jgi:fumarate reductase (CoM/CoB) subunit A
MLAAVEARKMGCRVIAMDKGIVGNDCSAVGAKQLAATGPWSESGDSARMHYEDTLKSGCYINDETLAHLLTSRIGRVVLALEAMGMPFDRDASGKKNRVLGPTPGHSKSRSLRFSDITGKLLVETIYTECRRRGVTLLSEHVAVDILKGQAGVCGALTIELASGQLIFVRAAAVVIATGGIGCLYELTSNPMQNTGDGIALALRAGAESMDLEFVQFYPVTVLFPPAIRGMNLNSHHYGAQLINALGERFMSKYYPEQMEHITRDKLSQSIFQEIQAGNAGPNAGVFMDATTIPGALYEKEIPSEWNLAKSVGIDLTKEKLEVAPSAHYYMGGIRIDERCQTSLRGLFAAGECCAGVQGANRLANNGLSEALVFGHLAGEKAGKYAADVKLPGFESKTVEKQVSRLQHMFEINGSRPRELIRRVQRIMTQNVGIIRNEHTLQIAVDALNELQHLKINGAFDDPWHPSILEGTSLRNMILLGQGIARAANARKESRGAHYRSDYPHMDDTRFKSNIVITMAEDGDFSIRIEDVNAKGSYRWNATK